MDDTAVLVNAIVVFGYLVGTIGFGVFLARYVKKDEDFFLAGRSLNQWVVGCLTPGYRSETAQRRRLGARTAALGSLSPRCRREPTQLWSGSCGRRRNRTGSSTSMS